MLSEEILIARAGNFTASENHRLMAGWDNPAPDTNFPEFELLYPKIKRLYEHGQRKFLVSDIKPLVDCDVNSKVIQSTVAAIKFDQPPTGLITYAEEKALEELFDYDPSLHFKTAHTVNGEERELECMEILAERTGINFVNTGENQAHIHSNGVGCTPDGIVLDELDMVETGAEVKCKSPLIHARNLLINNNADMLANAFEHYVQVQTAMLVTGADRWYFANYNPYAKSRLLQFKYIIVKRDNTLIEALQKRIATAKEIKARFQDEVLASVNERHDRAAA